MINQNIGFIRAYFLSFDEEAQEKIFSSLSDEQKDLIVEAGVVFLSNGGVETISGNSSLIEHKRELKEVQLEYFIGLADIIAAGGTNEVIEKLRRSKNLLFEEVLAEFKDNTLFENDLLAGIRNVERKALKDNLTLLDIDESDLGIPDAEIKYAISQIERNILKRRLQEIENSFSGQESHKGSLSRKFIFNNSQSKLWYYLAAASIFVFVLGFGYVYIKNNEAESIDSFSRLDNAIKRNVDVKKDLFVKSKRFEIRVLNDNFLNQSEGSENSSKIITVDVNYLNAEHEFSADETDTNYFSKHIQSVDENKKRKSTFNDLVSTYTFFDYQLALNIALSERNDQIYIVELTNESKFEIYLILNGNIYKLTKTKIPVKLVSISNKALTNIISNIVDEYNRRVD